MAKPLKPQNNCTRDPSVVSLDPQYLNKKTTNPDSNPNPQTVMKPITYALLAAAAACGLAGAQTAYTTPVGYVSVTTPANADTTVSACLNRAPELQTVATSASGSTLTLKAADIAANAFAFAPPSQPKTYYVKFLDGSLVGQYQTIDSNLASNDNGTPSDKTDDFVVLTLESPVVITGTPSVVVAPHWTLNTLFPGGAGVGTTTDPTEASALVLRQDQGIEWYKSRAQ